MSLPINELTISTPGRVCLFGEHQDYLHLPVVAAAISLRISISGKRRIDRLIKISLPDISGEVSIDLNEPVIYKEERDYFRSGLNVLLRNGYTFSSGFDCIVRGRIPINAGTSSSSALIVTWVNFLTRMSDNKIILPPNQTARYAYEAEVLEFSEPGGMMDQYSTSIGGIISIDFSPEVSVKRIDAPLKTFVLGNSHQPKDTKYILANVKDRVIGIDSMLKKVDTSFSLLKIDKDSIKDYGKYLNEIQYKLLDGTIENRDLTREARTELGKSEIDHKKIGILLNRHQEVLREVLGISTAKIDRMIDASIRSGAYGAKINGSGGGGCMFAYAPEDPGSVKEAIEAAGGEAFIIEVDTGSREEPRRED
jgi:galactokinase